MFQSSESSWWGLAPEVAYRIELGVAFVDDGDRTFKIDPLVIEGVVNADIDEVPSDEIEAELNRFPSVFERHASRAEAHASLCDES